MSPLRAVTERNGRCADGARCNAWRWYGEKCTVQYWAQATVDAVVKWTDVVTAVATAAAAVGTLLALVFVGLQLRSQSAALDNQRTLQVLAEQTKLQTQQAGHVAEQTRLLTQQVETVASTNRAILYQNVTNGGRRLR